MSRLDDHSAIGTEREKNVLTPDGTFYSALAKECGAAQVRAPLSLTHTHTLTLSLSRARALSLSLSIYQKIYMYTYIHNYTYIYIYIYGHIDVNRYI